VLVGAAIVAEGDFGQLRMGDFDRADIPLAAIVTIAAIASVTAMFTRDHISLGLVLSGVGFCLAIAYALFSAPDVALVAVLIETLFALLFFSMLVRLPRDVDLAEVQGESGSMLSNDPARRSRRDRILAVIAGGFAFIVAWSVLSDPAALTSVASEHVARTPSAHGKDIVTVILADFRGLDTMGEITVIGIAFLGIATLINRRRQA
jgi:multicomponent Na+:H+ antiporter subunit A